MARPEQDRRADQPESEELVLPPGDRLAHLGVRPRPARGLLIGRRGVANDSRRRLARSPIRLARPVWPDPGLPDPVGPAAGLPAFDLGGRALDEVRFLDDPQLDMAVPPYQSTALANRYSGWTLWIAPFGPTTMSSEPPSSDRADTT